MVRLQAKAENNPTLFLCDSPVRSWTGDPLRCDFADQETVTWTADVLLSHRGVLYRLQRQRRTFSFSVEVFPFLGLKIGLSGSVLISSAEILHVFLRQDIWDVWLLKRVYSVWCFIVSDCSYSKPSDLCKHGKKVTNLQCFIIFLLCDLLSINQLLTLDKNVTYFYGKNELLQQQKQTWGSK